MKIILTLFLGALFQHAFAQSDTTKSTKINVPPAFVVGSYGGKIAVDKFKQATQIEIDHDWEITGYMIYVSGAGFPNPMFKQVMRTGQFDKDVIELIGKCEPGTIVTFDELSAKNRKTGTKLNIKAVVFHLY